MFKSEYLSSLVSVMDEAGQGQAAKDEALIWASKALEYNFMCSKPLYIWLLKIEKAKNLNCALRLVLTDSNRYVGLGVEGTEFEWALDFNWRCLFSLN